MEMYAIFIYISDGMRNKVVEYMLIAFLFYYSDLLIL